MTSPITKVWRVQDIDGNSLLSTSLLSSDTAHKEAVKCAGGLNSPVYVWELIAVYQKGEAPIEKMELTQVPECQSDVPQTPTPATCQKKLMQENKAYPRTCPTCGISGHCHLGL